MTFHHVRPEMSNTVGSSPRTDTIQSKRVEQARGLLLSCLQPLEHTETAPRGTINDKKCCQADVSVQASHLGNMIQQDGESKDAAGMLTFVD